MWIGGATTFTSCPRLFSRSAKIATTRIPPCKFTAGSTNVIFISLRWSLMAMAESNAGFRRSRPTRRQLLHNLDLLENATCARAMGLDPDSHAVNSLFQRCLGPLPKNPLGFAVVRKGTLYLIARLKVLDLASCSHLGRYNLRQVVDRERNVSTDVENLVSRGTNVYRSGHNRGDIVDVRKRALLLAIAKDGHWLPLQDLIHEDTHHVSVTVADILPFAVHIVGPEDDVVKAEDFMGDPQFLLDSKLGNPIGVLRDRHHILRHWCLPGPIYRDRRGKHETLCLMIYC